MRWLLQGVCLAVGDMGFQRDILVISSSNPYTVLYVQLKVETLCRVCFCRTAYPMVDVVSMQVTRFR